MYATDEVMVQAGLEAEQGAAPKLPKEPRTRSAATGAKAPAPAEDPALARATRDELEAMLEHALVNEDYERTLIAFLSWTITYASSRALPS
jgi:septal ring-binding cell division protein DamX